MLLLSQLIDPFLLHVSFELPNVVNLNTPQILAL